MSFLAGLPPPNSMESLAEEVPLPDSQAQAAASSSGGEEGGPGGEPSFASRRRPGAESSFVVLDGSPGPADSAATSTQSSPVKSPSRPWAGEAAEEAGAAGGSGGGSGGGGGGVPQYTLEFQAVSDQQLQRELESEFLSSTAPAPPVDAALQPVLVRWGWVAKRCWLVHMVQGCLLRGWDRSRAGCLASGRMTSCREAGRQAAVLVTHCSHPFPPTALTPAPLQDFELACTPLQFWGRFLSNASDFLVGSGCIPAAVCMAWLCALQPEAAMLAVLCGCGAAHTYRPSQHQAPNPRNPGPLNPPRAGAIPRVTRRQRHPAGQVDAALQGGVGGRRRV